MHLFPGREIWGEGEREGKRGANYLSRGRKGSPLFFVSPGRKWRFDSRQGDKFPAEITFGSGRERGAWTGAAPFGTERAPSWRRERNEDVSPSSFCLYPYRSFRTLLIFSFSLWANGSVLPPSKRGKHFHVFFFIWCVVFVNFSFSNSYFFKNKIWLYRKKAISVIKDLDFLLYINDA